VHVALVLREFLADPERPRYGLDLMGVTGMQAGTMYVILARLTAAGWLDRTWEDVDQSAAGRPRRRFYRLTGDGEQLAAAALAALNARLQPPAP